jgi:hypothetical protein
VSAGTTRELNALRRKAKRLGFAIERTAKGHYLWRDPSGRTETHGGSPRRASVTHVARWVRQWSRP